MQLYFSVLCSTKPDQPHKQKAVLDGGFFSVHAEQQGSFANRTAGSLPTESLPSFFRLQSGHLKP